MKKFFMLFTACLMVSTISSQTIFNHTFPTPSSTQDELEPISMEIEFENHVTQPCDLSEFLISENSAASTSILNTLENNPHFWFKTPNNKVLDMNLVFEFEEKNSSFIDPAYVDLHDEVHIRYQDDVFFTDLSGNYGSLFSNPNGFVGGDFTANFQINVYDANFDYPFTDELTITFYKAIDPFVGGTPTEIAYQFVARIFVEGAYIQGDPSWTTTAPATVQMILRDPPGDRSYTQMTNSTTNCHGYGVSLAQDNSLTTWASVRIGAEGSGGFLVEKSYSVYSELSAEFGVGVTQTSSDEFKMCYTTTNTFQTDDDGGILTGSQGDVFIGSSVTYAYGIYHQIKMLGCEPVLSKDFMLGPNDPTATVQSFRYTEYDIVNSIIPNLQTHIDSLPLVTPADSAVYYTAVDQMEMWTQAIDWNNELKSAAIANNSPLKVNSFTGGSGFDEFDQSISTSEIKTMEMNLYIDASVSAELGVNIGGTGGTLGARVRVRMERGSSTTASNSSTNTVKAHFEDKDLGDLIDYKVHADPVFGTPVYELTEVTSKTRCPYEGGYQRDQPLLKFSDDSDELTITSIPVGQAGNFQLDICNESNEDRTYILEVVGGTNPGTIITGSSGPLQSNGSGSNFLVPAFGCLENNQFTITQVNQDSLNFEGIELILYDNCNQGTAPGVTSIISSVTLNALFEETNAVDDIFENQISMEVFPNPNEGQFNIQIKNAEKGGQMRLTDLTGRVVYQQDVARGTVALEVNQKQLPKGMYLLSFRDEAQQVVQKIVIE